MAELFLKIVNMSISAAWLVLAVLIVRLFMKKAPGWTHVLLWGIVAMRLICPFTPESPVSLVPESVGSGEVLSGWMDDYVGEARFIHEGAEGYDEAVAAGREPVYAGDGSYVVTAADGISAPRTVADTVLPVLAAVWAGGMVLMLLYTALSYWRLRRKLGTAVLYRDNIYQSENAASPFVLGLLRPRIYLPYGLDDREMGFVLAHEQAHIRRRDHWWKPLGFLLLSIHWFNPILWAAYILLCRDIELACDEKVIGALGEDQRADYSQALLNCSVSRRSISACPLAFGELSVKERVKNVLSYKKPGFWVMAAAVVLCAVMAVCFLTDPQAGPSVPDTALEDLPADYSLEQAKRDGCVVLEDGDVTSGQEIWYSFAEQAWKGRAAAVRFATWYNMPANASDGYYEAHKDEYPKMVVHDLTFDGREYTVRWYEEGQEHSRTYAYLMYYNEEPDSSGATYRSCERYVLTDDNKVTWDQLLAGLASSRLGDLIDFYPVYQDYIYKNDPTLAELERIKEKLESYMLDYGIATLDANERTMTLDIEIREEAEGLEELVSGFIDLSHVRISRLEGELVFVGAGEDRLAPGIYVAAECPYMSVASSYILIPGDYRYEVTEDSFVTMGPGGSVTAAVNWKWQEGEAGKGTLKFLKNTAFAAMWGKCRYQRLGNMLFLVEKDDALYLVRAGDSRSDLTAVWSVYWLLPEAEYEATAK